MHQKKKKKKRKRKSKLGGFSNCPGVAGIGSCNRLQSYLYGHFLSIRFSRISKRLPAKLKTESLDSNQVSLILLFSKAPCGPNGKAIKIGFKTQHNTKCFLLSRITFRLRAWALRNRQKIRWGKIELRWDRNQKNLASTSCLSENFNPRP